MTHYMKTALVTAAIAAGCAALPAAAQQVASVEVTAMPQQDDAPYYGTDTDIVVGAVKDPKAPRATEDVKDAKIPEMPVVYETPAVAVKPAAPVTGS